MAGYEAWPLPGSFPEQRQDPRESVGSGGDCRVRCECGQPAWVFPAPGKRYCGFCPASVAARRAK